VDPKEDQRGPIVIKQPLFKWRHFETEIILLCVRWYLRYALSYRDLEEMMRERGLHVDHTTIYRWGKPLRSRVGEALPSSSEGHQRFLAG
jgi:transposase-like protein